MNDIEREVGQAAFGVEAGRLREHTWRVGYTDGQASETVEYGNVRAVGGTGTVTAENPKDVQAQKEGKVDLSLIPAAASEGMARALMDGARKYGPWNWRTDKIKMTTYVAAIKRHLDALMEREDVAADSKLHHFDHILANAAIAKDAIKHGCMIDDRPKSNAVLLSGLVPTYPMPPSAAAPNPIGVRWEDGKTQ